MFQNNTTTIVLVSAIIVSTALMGLGLLVVNPAISANAQVSNGTQQQSITDEQNTVAIQKTEVSALDRSMHPSNLFLCPEGKFGTSASNGTPAKN